LRCEAHAEFFEFKIKSSGILVIKSNEPLNPILVNLLVLDKRSDRALYVRAVVFEHF